MPFKSKAQAKRLAMLAAQGKFSKEAFQEWAGATTSWKSLPERVKKKKKHGTSKK